MITYLVQPHLQYGQHVLLDDQRLIIQVLDDECMLFAINLQYDRFDGGVTFDKNT